MAYSYVDGLEKLSKDRYLLKLRASGLDMCPYRIPAGAWINNPQSWPNVQWPDVYAYLIETPGVFTREAMKNWKSLEAHNYFISGWVQTVYHMPIESTDNLVLAADVRPSQRMNHPPHHPWMTCRKNGEILTEHCDCMAGLGESCSHVAALMFKVEAAIQKGYKSRACTEELCQWNQCFIKKIEPARIASINFYKESVQEHFQSPTGQHIKSTSASEIERQNFLKTVSSSKRPPIVLSSFSHFHKPFVHKCIASDIVSLPIDMRSLFKTRFQPDSTAAMKQAMARIVVSESQVNYLEKQTRAQASSHLWHQMRIGRITASKAYKFCHTNEAAPAQSLVKSICELQGTLSVPAIKWGKDNEAKALKEFQDSFASVHENVEVVATGLRLSVNEPFLGASPDGLVKCSCCEASVIEIKCPFKFKEYDLTDIYAHPLCCITNENQLKKNHEYYCQVQVQMYIFNVVSAQFVYWTPKFCVITQVKRYDFIARQITKLTDIWKQFILPELLTRSLETETVATVNTNPKLYCYCQKVIEEKMVGCDNPKCQFEWFHLSCLKRKTVPKGKWFCQYCKKLPTNQLKIKHN